LVLLTTTSAQRMGHRPPKYLSTTSYHLTNGKDVGVVYSADTFEGFRGKETFDFNLRLRSNGLVYFSPRISSIGKDCLSQSNFSIKMEESVIGQGYISDDVYSTYEEHLFSLMRLPIEISHKESDVKGFLEMVNYRGEIESSPDFFTNVVKAYRKYEKNRKPLIWVEKN